MESAAAHRKPLRIAGAVLWWLAPIIFLFWLYAPGLRVWFVADDFAWLGLLRQLHGVHDFLHAMFAPAAQGTLRFWSERGFFMLFESLFGLDSLPFRLLVFLTMAANLALVAWLTVRLTGSRLAGFLAPILWTANTALSTVMDWNSSYNEALCPFFLLLATTLLVRYVETGRRVFWWWQVVVFLLGFGALEVNAVYPAIAAAYVLLLAPEDNRKRVLSGLIPLFPISAGYYLLHRAIAPLETEGPYAMHFDGRIFKTLGIYWQWSLVPGEWTNLGHSRWLGNAALVVLSGALAVFFLRQTAKSRHFVVFAVFWYLITLAPMLPLADHRSGYYLTIPLIGLAMLGAWGVALAWQTLEKRQAGSNRAWVLRSGSLLLLILYLTVTIPASRAASMWWLERSEPVRGMVLGVAAAHRAHPDKVIVLAGVTSSLYDNAIAHSAFYPLGLDDVYLAPASALTIHPSVHPEVLEKVAIDPGVLRNAVANDEVVIYSVAGDHLRNITGAFERSAVNRLSDEEPRRVDVGNPLFAYLLGPEWLPLESGFRWMPRKATVRLGGPKSRSDLVLEGYCPESQLKSGPVHLLVSVDGVALKEAQIDNPESNFRRLFDMPASLVGRKEVQVTLAADRVLHGADGIDRSVVFGTIAIVQR